MNSSFFQQNIYRCCDGPYGRVYVVIDNDEVPIEQKFLYEPLNDCYCVLRDSLIVDSDKQVPSGLYSFVGDSGQRALYKLDWNYVKERSIRTPYAFYPQ
jgi:hypothetical protein